MTDKLQEPDVELGDSTHTGTEPSSLRKVHTLVLKRPSHRAALSGSDDYGYDESHYFELDEGENWLRLSQTESRHSILDDTQDFSQDSHNWFASILSLSSVGEPVNVSNNCYLCLDVDGTIMAIKDMRSPSSHDDYPPLGLARIVNNQSSTWELLPRRQLRILHPGDRICTAYEQGTPNGLVMEYQYRHLTRSKLLDSQRNALDLLTQPMEDDDDEDEEETQTEPTPTCNVQIVETQNYDSDSTAEMTQSQVAVSAQPSLGLSTQPDDDEADADEHDSVKKAKNQLHHHHDDGPELPSTPCDPIVMSKKQGLQNIPSPIAEVDEAESPGDITQELVIATPIAISRNGKGQKNDDTNNIVDSETPQSNNEEMSTESTDIETGNGDPSPTRGDQVIEKITSKDVLPQEPDHSTPSNSLSGLQAAECNGLDKLNEIAEPQQNISTDQGNVEEPTNTKRFSSQNEGLVQEDGNPIEPPPETNTTVSNEDKDMPADSTELHSKSDGKMESNRTFTHDNSLGQSVEVQNNGAPSHEAASSQEISLSMLRETGEETPMEGVDPTGKEDDQSDVTDVEIMDQGGQSNQSTNAASLHQNVNLASNDNDSEITEVDDVVPSEKEPQESVKFLKKFPRPPKYDDDSEITEIDIDPVRPKAEKVVLDPESLQPDNASGDDENDKEVSLVSNEAGPMEPKEVTDQVDDKASQLSKCEEDKTTGDILTTIAHEAEEINRLPVGVDAANVRTEVSDDIQDVVKANDDMESDTNKVDSPNQAPDLSALVVEEGVDKTEDKQEEDDGKQSSKPEEQVNNETLTESTHLDSTSDCLESANAPQTHDEHNDGVEAPIADDANEARSTDGVQNEQEETDNSPEGLVNVDAKVEEEDTPIEAEALSKEHGVHSSNQVANPCSNKPDGEEEFKTTEQEEENKATAMEEENQVQTGPDGETSEVGQEESLITDNSRKSKRKLRAEAYERAVEGMAHDKLQVQETQTKRRRQSGLVGANVHATKSSTEVNSSTPQTSLPVGKESGDETSLQQGKSRRKSKRMHGVLNDVSSPLAPASISSSTSSATWSTRKRARGTPPAWNLDENPPIRVMATNVEIDSKGKQMVKKIGGVFIETIEDAFQATHVIAASKDVKLKRTPKFMVAISRTSNMVHLDWLIESARKGEALDTQEFLLLDQTEAEKQYNFKLSESLARGNKLRAKGTLLLDSVDMFLCNGVAGSVREGDKTPPAKDFRLILEGAGAKVLTTLAQRSSEKGKMVIVTSKDAKERKKQLAKRDVATAVKQGAIVKTAEEIFHAIMTQDFKI